MKDTLFHPISKIILSPLVIILLVLLYKWLAHLVNKRKANMAMKETDKGTTSTVEPPATKNFKASDVIPPFPNQNPSADTPIDIPVCPVAPDCGSEPLKEEPPKPVAPNVAAPGNLKRRN